MTLYLSGSVAVGSRVASKAASGPGSSTSLLVVTCRLTEAVSGEPGRAYRATRACSTAPQAAPRTVQPGTAAGSARGQALPRGSTARLNLCLPLRIVDVSEHPETNTLVQLRRALRAAIELRSGPVREDFSIAEHA